MIRVACIACRHVMKDGLPILRARRDPPDEEVPEDSGWQFLCRSGAEENAQTAMVVSISTVLVLDPSIAPYLKCEPGTIIQRDAGNLPWQVIK